VNVVAVVGNVGVGVGDEKHVLDGEVLHAWVQLYAEARIPVRAVRGGCYKQTD
jgi:hypothetical protein